MSKWLATFVGLTGVLLLGEGLFYVGVADGLRTMEPGPNGAWPTAEFVAVARSVMPAAYMVIGEGFVFGVLAVVGSIGMFARKPWAWRLTLAASVLLALTSIAVGFMMPSDWDTQAVFLVLCALLWWDARKWRAS